MFFKPKKPEELQGRYAQMCARIGDIEFQIKKLAQAKCGLLKELDKIKAEYDKNAKRFAPKKEGETNENQSI